MGSSARKPAVAFIFVTLVLIILGFGILIPIIPNLVKQFNGGNLSSGSGEYGLLLGVYAFMQFIFSPILGSLSDRFGRKKVLPT
jgi:DHA1 family tetracycline resistance protein-like MFS transporter